jgi:HJR/Mrr/RecB family endonuclease
MMLLTLTSMSVGLLPITPHNTRWFVKETLIKVPQDWICRKPGCTEWPWIVSPFCLTHFLEHLEVVLSAEDKARFDSTFEQVLRTLTYREREILKLRYGFGDGYVYTRKECGLIFKISPEHVREVEAVAVRKLQHPVRVREIEKALKVYPFPPPSDEFIRAVKTSERELIRFVNSNPNSIYTIGSRDFEKIITEVFRGFGFQVELTQQTRDGGVDIIAFSKDLLGIKTKYVIECKRYAANRPIRVHMVRAFYTVKAQKRADHAIYATTSYFTRDAEKLSLDPEISNLHLRDFNQIKKWLTVYMELVEKGGVLLGVP